MKITKEIIKKTISEEIKNTIKEAELPGPLKPGRVSDEPIDMREVYDILWAASRVLYDDAARAGLATTLQNQGHEELALSAAKLRGGLLDLMSNIHNAYSLKKTKD